MHKHITDAKQAWTLWTSLDMVVRLELSFLYFIVKLIFMSEHFYNSNSSPFME